MGRISEVHSQKIVFRSNRMLPPFLKGGEVVSQRVEILDSAHVPYRD